MENDYMTRRPAWQSQRLGPTSRLLLISMLCFKPVCRIAKVTFILGTSIALWAAVIALVRWLAF
jgi:hypothetical protein